MATWQYDDWITLPTPAAREAQLRLHIQEVSKLMTPDVSKGNASMSTGSLAGYLSELKADLKELMAVTRPRHSYAKIGGTR
jgi:hypothetical protein